MTPGAGTTSSEVLHRGSRPLGYTVTSTKKHVPPPRGSPKAKLQPRVSSHTFRCQPCLLVPLLLKDTTKARAPSQDGTNMWVLGQKCLLVVSSGNCLLPPMGEVERHCSPCAPPIPGTGPGAVTGSLEAPPPPAPPSSGLLAGSGSTYRLPQDTCLLPLRGRRRPVDAAGAVPAGKARLLLQLRNAAALRVSGAGKHLAWQEDRCASL